MCLRSETTLSGMLEETGWNTPGLKTIWEAGIVTRLQDLLFYWYMENQ